jgi:putative PIG3 family NAD(P)H quinone oxidoreductase
MVKSRGDLFSHALDLAFQRPDPFLELLDRQRIEILFDQHRQRIAGLARKELVEVHAAGIDPLAPRCQLRLLRTGGFPANCCPMTTIEKTMIAIDPAAPGGPDVLVPVERPVPRPKAGEYLVAVEAAGVNRPDVLQRRGLYPPPPGAPSILGLEIAGTIVAAGEGADEARIGERVCALVAGGGYARYCVAPASQCLPAPAPLSMAEAAALPETFFTVWTNLFRRGGAKKGDLVLVHGGTSGIGTTVILLGKVFGLSVIVTAGSPAKCARALEIGAAHAIDYRAERFEERVAALTGGRGVDVVLDMIGGDYLARNLSCLAEEGRHVSIAVQRGATAEIPIHDVMRRRLTLTGSTLRARPPAFKAALAAELYEQVWPHLESGAIRPVIDSVHKLENAADAHRRMESSEHVGKIVLQVGR